MREPPRLYTTFEIAQALGVSRSWIHTHLRPKYSSPPPDFVAVARGGKNLNNLWTEASLVRWQAYHASTEPQSGIKRYSGYSDHNAVNMVGSLTVTWKLWWQPAPNGDSPVWWLSTPEGWWTSTSDGRMWVPTGLMTRPVDNRYVSVTGNVKPGTVVAVVLASIARVREQIEGSVKQ